MLEGMVFHDEMSRYYAFLGFKGYAKCHEYHYAEETIGYRKLSAYVLSTHNQLIPTLPMERPNVIPDSWYGVDQMKVDRGTKQSGIKKGYEKWIEWETKTKALYEEMKDVPCVTKYLESVTEELAIAKEKYMMLEAIGYDLPTICSKQEHLEHMYEDKIKSLF